ncbi:glycine zipper 2TM domain-containing protein [Ideonella sp. A 288]|uniref:glycine zipper 2TM domain-containing protein n=1 Tax=Ideonella sp. A 288 TaxID=1962181 RepID=UPI000B4B360E|nr:glycine zipper 2TM domain-containing protein [Ideonella sp. A 288]
MKNIASRVALIAAVALLGACAQVQPINDRPPVYSSSRPAAVEYGVVSAIERFRADEQVSGGGALAGGVAGAVIGRQFGGSSEGRAMGTFIGAVAGVLLGNQIEKQHNGQRAGVRISVQLDGGGQRSFDYAQAGDLRVGDRVRVEGHQIARM